MVAGPVGSPVDRSAIRTPWGGDPDRPAGPPSEHRHRHPARQARWIGIPAHQAPPSHGRRVPPDHAEPGVLRRVHGGQAASPCHRDGAGQP
jgi:hypothetical protein